MIALRRLLQRSLAVAAALAVVGSFGWVLARELGVRTNQDDGIVLRVMHWSGGGGEEEDAIVADAISRFEAAHPGITVQRINPGDTAQFMTKLQTMMAADAPPDVFYMDASRLPLFAETGQLAVLDDRLRGAGDDALTVDAFFPAALDAFRWDGERPGHGALYGIPKDFTTLGFYYNRALFRRAGLSDPADDWSWDDFIATARAIGALDDDTYGAELVTWPFVLRGYLWTEGVEIRGEDWNDLRLNQPELHAALDRLRAWRHDESGAIARAEAEGIDPASRFLTGQYGMVGPLGRWVVPQFRTIPEPDAGGFDWDFAPLPRGRTNANVIATAAWSMAAQTEYPEESWTLLQFLTGASSQARQAELGLAIPSLRNVAHSPAFIDASRRPQNDQAFLDAATNARLADWPLDARFSDRWERTTGLIVKLGQDAEGPLADLQSWWEAEQASPLAGDSFSPMPWRTVLTVGLAVAAVLVFFITVRRRRTALSRSAIREEWAGYALIGPWLVGFAVFMALPIIVSAVLSFARWNGIGPLSTAEYVGAANYRHLLTHDETFRAAIRVTAYYACIAVPTGQLIALLAALLLNTTVRGISLFRAAWYLPSVLAGVGIAVLWQWVFKSDGGLLNAALLEAAAWFGWEGTADGQGWFPPEWFNRHATWLGPPAFAIMNLWMVGGSMMIYLAGLRNIPRELYEAAAIDRIGPVRRLFAITLPMLGPVLLFNGIMAIIASFQVFTQAYVMTAGGPGDATMFLVLYIYNLAFDFYRMGYASALAWILLAIVLVFTAIVMRTSRRFVYYEALEG